MKHKEHKASYKCPLCQKPVVEDMHSYLCSRYEGKGIGCQFRIFKKMFGVPLPHKALEDLIVRGMTEETVCGFLDKETGQIVSRRLYYNYRHNQVRFWYDREDYLKHTNQKSSSKD